jgi:predicted dehydrogenase
LIRIQKKLRIAEQKGYRNFNNLDEALEKIEADLYSVCVPTKDHLKVLKKILNFNHKAKVILEKPPCQPNETEEILQLEKNYNQAKIVVNERYASSYVTQKVIEFIKKYDVNEKILEIEFTKNRMKDVVEGRFLDEELGVLGYEGPHMLTIVSNITKNFRLRKILGKSRDGKNILEKQGEAYLKYVTEDNSLVNFYTSHGRKNKIFN